MTWCSCKAIKLGYFCRKEQKTEYDKSVVEFIQEHLNYYKSLAMYLSWPTDSFQICCPSLPSSGKMEHSF